MRMKDFDNWALDRCFPDKKKPKKEQDAAVSHVSKHNAKEKWKSNGCKERRICLFVLCHSISFDNLLRGSRVGVQLKMCGPFF